MNRDILNQKVTAAFQFNLETVLDYLELRHDEAQEFKSVRQGVLLKHPNTGESIETLRWADPPEKKVYLAALRETLKEFAKPECAETAAELFGPIIDAYYATCRARYPLKAKVKEPVTE